MIYLAAPYNDKNKIIIQERIDKIYIVIAEFIKMGYHVITPLLMHEVVTRHNIDGSFSYWEDYCFNLLSRCDKMYVLCIDDWDNRPGVQKEIEYCREHGIPIQYISNDFFEHIK
ncbi:MAG: DUF1937 family protein [Flavobacterium sp.]|uniref:DUF1937 family protein n=1 Tax=Flavobacterium sp. TaxID=239 RepID=UPI0026301B3A|nr:DUF1937 family protein [Flavobacterium sp.]MDD5150173.1 DUF1937 family protein [Flavobacterium sp.]